MLWITESDATADALQLFAPRVAWGEVAADVLQDAGHLTEQVLRGRDVEQVRLGGMKIAHCPFPKRAVARQMQISPGAQRSNAGGLPGRFDVGIDPVNQAVAGSLRVLRDHP